MVYVIVGGEKVHRLHDGVYCKIMDMRDGKWNHCRWGKVKDATVFSSYEEAQNVIKNAREWAECVTAQVAAIHPLNITCT